jgi:hypothetical protein
VYCTLKLLKNALKGVLVKLTAIVPIFGPTYAGRKHQIGAILANSRNVRVSLVLDSFGDSERESIEICIRNLHDHEIELIEGDFGNPGSARNSALDRVETEWFCFWDSDDMPDIGKYLEMVNSAEASNVPIAKGGYKIVSKSGKIFEKIVIPTIGPSHPAEHISDPGLWRYALNKKIYGELRFPPIRMGEDQDYLVQALMITDSVHIFPQAVYSYSVGGNDQLTQSAVNSEEVYKSLHFLSGLRSKKLQDRRKNEIIVTSFLKQFASLLVRKGPKKFGKNWKFLAKFLGQTIIKCEMVKPLKILIRGTFK